MIVRLDGSVGWILHRDQMGQVHRAGSCIMPDPKDRCVHGVQADVLKAASPVRIVEIVVVRLIVKNGLPTGGIGDLLQRECLHVGETWKPVSSAKREILLPCGGKTKRRRIQGIHSRNENAVGLPVEIPPVINAEAVLCRGAARIWVVVKKGVRRECAAG